LINVQKKVTNSKTNPYAKSRSFTIITVHIMVMRLHKHFVLMGLVFCLGLAITTPASAQTIIRDTEIESMLQDWLKPVFAAANVSPDQVDIILVQDSQINAFVAGGSNIFIYTGLLQKTENPGEVIGVLAHELGHITGGHLIRGREAMENASYESILGMILGVGAAIATGNGGAIPTLGTAGSSMAQRRFLANSRAFESSADQAAMTYLEKAQINPSGLASFLEKLSSQELLPQSQQSEYVRTHPLTRTRIEAVEARTAQSAFRTSPYPDAWQSQHKMMLAKLTGFITPQQVEWVYDVRDQSIPAKAARAIAAYRQSDVARALKLADELIAAEPNNPYFQELKGQMLVDFGRVKESVPFYEKAVSLKPDAPLILTALAHAQIETAQGNQAVLAKAVQHLTRALQKDPRSSRVHRLLATAYGRMGQESEAKLHLAEEALLQRKKDYAKTQAQAALNGLKSGSPSWIRAKDILSYIETMKE